MNRYLLFASVLLILLISYTISSPGHLEKSYKIAKYEVSLQYAKLSQREWWTRIEPYGIYLGALPLDNEGHFEQILGLGIHSILSMVEDFELEEGLFNVPVKHDQWRRANLTDRHIKAVDFRPLEWDQIQDGLTFLRQEYRAGRSVYLHCKAGRGRSAAILVGFMMEKEEGLTLDEAISRIKAQRPEINLNTNQRLALIDYYK